METNLKVDKLHITESLTRLGGVETLVRQLIESGPGHHAAALLDPPGGGILKGSGLRSGKLAGSVLIRRAARARFAHATHLIFHNFAGMMMLSGTIPHARKSLFLHTNSQDVFELLPQRLPYLDTIFVGGSDLKAELHARFPGIKVPIAAVEIPLDDRYFEARTRTPGTTLTIGYCGRIEIEQKQVLRLVDLCRELTALEVPFQLEIAGSGSAADELRRSLNLVNCRFLGVLNSSELHAAYQRWDFMICTSDYETGPLVAMEAMASGLIPILPDTPCQATSLVVGLDLPLYPTGDMKTAANLIATLSGSIALDHLRTGLREKVADRRIDRFVKKINAVLDETANRPSIGRTPTAPQGMTEFLPFKFRRSDNTYLR
jgi:glycosyltransferase involved in cell wall biosynthesis